MKYFILELDKNYTAPMIKEGVEKLGDRAVGNKNWSFASQYMTFEIQQDMQTTFTDIISFPTFMVSEAAMNVIAMYESSMKFTRVILTDRKQKISRRYYIPGLEEIECFTSDSNFNLDKSVIYHAKIKENKVREKKLFRAGGVKCRCIIVRLDLAESMLRRKLMGIGLRETTIVHAKEQEEITNERDLSGMQR